MKKLISVESLSYKYNKMEKYTIKNISFSAEQGDMIAIIGRSGSGKTTIINSTLGLYSNIEGEVKFYNNVTKKDIDYCMQNQSVDWYLNVYDNIYMGSLYSNSKSDKKYVDNIIDVLELKGKEKADLTELSGGQLQRVQIARALVSKSKILFLDEPTVGLDIILSKKILSYIKDNNKENVVFISSHDLDLIEEYCNKILYINAGNCLYFGEMKEFLKKYNKEVVYSINYEGTISEKLLESMENNITIISDYSFTVSLKNEKDFSQLLKDILAENITIISLQKEENTLKKILELGG